MEVATAVEQCPLGKRCVPQGTVFDSPDFHYAHEMEGTSGWSATNQRLARVEIRFLCLPPLFV